MGYPNKRSLRNSKGELNLDQVEKRIFSFELNSIRLKRPILILYYSQKVKGSIKLSLYLATDENLQKLFFFSKKERELVFER